MYLSIVEIHIRATKVGSEARGFLGLDLISWRQGIAL